MDDYVHYGNPLRELDDDKAPKRFQDDTVRDERGRRRFHGAFTGGFSAGYFNSVGTKEGWTPQQFVSSRSKRAENTGAQKPEDFMDSEDCCEMGIAPQRIQLREGVRSQDANTIPLVKQPRTAGVGSQRELLQAPLIRMLASDREGIGARILRGMGWRPGRGVGPLVSLSTSYGPQLPENALACAEVGPEEVAEDILLIGSDSAKDNVWGLGYTPMQRLDLFGHRVDRERVTMSTATVGGRRLDIRGQAFGVGAFEDEDDEDIYARDDLSQYTFEEGEPHLAGTSQCSSGGGPGSTNSRSSNIIGVRPHLSGGQVEGFVTPGHRIEPLEISGHGNRIQVPAEWTPRTALLAVAAHLLTSGRTGSESNAAAVRKQELSRDEKVALISDKAEGSVFDLMSADDKCRIESARKAIQDRNLVRPSFDTTVSRDTGRIAGSELKNCHSKVAELTEVESSSQHGLGKIDIESLRPFASDPAKEERFERFIRFAEQGQKAMLLSIQPPGMSQWEAALEKSEFESALLLVKPRLGLSSRFEKKPAGIASDSGLPTGLSAPKDIAATQSFSRTTETMRPPLSRPLKDFGKNTHGQVEWHPKALLCKRFNVPNPYPGDDTVGIPPSAIKNFQSDGTSLSTDEPVVGSTKPSTVPPEKSTKSQAKSTSVVLGSFSVKRFEDLLEEEVARTPPPMDLFKFIFSDDDDSDDDDGTHSDDISTNNRVDGTDKAQHDSQLLPSDDTVKFGSSVEYKQEHDSIGQLETSSTTVPTQKSSGLFANLDLSLLNKRPPPKAMESFATGTILEEAPSLPPMGPMLPPMEMTTCVFKKEHASKGKKRSKEPKKHDRKKKAKKKLVKKSSKRKKKKSLSNKKRRHRDRNCSDSSDTSTSSSSTSDNEETHFDDNRLDQTSRKRLCKYTEL